MSLQSDFARNRAVFEALTGTAVTADSPELRSARETRSVPVRERAESAARRELQPPEENLPPQTRRYSLAYGSKRETGMALHFEAPDDVAYPALGKASPEPPTDPLENLYYRLGVEARMSSQLCGEED